MKTFIKLPETCERPITSYLYENDRTFSLEHIRQEYLVFGTMDYRQPAVDIRQENGSRILDFKYQGYTITKGKPALEGLPATYTESDDEAETLTLSLKDEISGVCAELLYTIFRQGGILARSVRLCNQGSAPVQLERAMSLSLDLPDRDYEWLQLSGCWARECHIRKRKEAKEQIAFMKQYRNLLQFGTFYRLKSPFEDNETVWMTVSQDQKNALVGWYRTLNCVNASYTRVRLEGLNPAYCYRNKNTGLCHYGDELMHAGLITSDDTAGQVPADALSPSDFESRIYVLEVEES